MTEPPLPRLWIRSPHVPEVLFLALAPPCLESIPSSGSLGDDVVRPLGSLPRVSPLSPRLALRGSGKELSHLAAEDAGSLHAGCEPSGSP